jgi:DNA-binding transcriptional LysR family regulator
LRVDESRRLLRNTRLIALIPRRIASRMRDRTELREPKLPFNLPEVVIAMGWHPSNTADPGHAWLRQIVARAAKTLD